VDYITKPFDPAELRARISIVLQMIELQERLVAQANTDELTGLANRRHFQEMLDREILRARTGGNELSLMMIDLDHFKNINDTYGHLGGDVVLRQLAEILREQVQQLDIVARYGGEEFVVVMPGASSKQARAAAERLRHTVAATHWGVSADRVSITISCGLATLNAFDSLDGLDLIKRADTALYVAKRRGRNCVICWEDIGLDETTELPADTEDLRNLQGKLNRLARELRLQMLAGVSALTKALEVRDPYMLHHSENVQTYARAIAEELGMDEEFIEHLSVAARLHDLGKLGIPDEILSKAGGLSPRERHLVEQHPLVSVQILEPLGLHHEEIRTVKHHHERFDGGGYPTGLMGRKIPFGSRILAVADTFDALTANAAYRETVGLDEALDEIRRQAGAQFDPEIVEAFIRVARKHRQDWPLRPAAKAAFST